MIPCDFLQCPNCGSKLIADEAESHQCKRVVDYRIENNILWLSDGERWYPRKLVSPKNKHPNTTPKDSTEPKLLI
ncbi:MAG TPA: hypothetical protein VE818_03715, partial [Nitrososphaeraceae archaeon]|nr:hypothetical protein [Nitrososphaeraceae archaeon]